MKNTRNIILVIVVLLAIVGIYKLSNSSKNNMNDMNNAGKDQIMMHEVQKTTAAVHDFETCVQEGGMVDEKYPNECVYDGDMVFVRDFTLGQE